MIEKICVNCGKRFATRERKRKYCSLYCWRHSQECISHVKGAFLGKKHTPETIEKIRENSKKTGFQSMEKHPHWMGGRFQHPTGYILIKKPSHPRAWQNGYVPEHRLIMEKILRRYLKPEESIHHINGIKSDNRPENLKLASIHTHNPWGADVTCPFCHKTFCPTP